MRFVRDALLALMGAFLGVAIGLVAHQNAVGLLLFGALGALVLAAGVEWLDRRRKRPQAPTRVYVDVTPEELVGFFKNVTAMQGDRLVQPYIGKWITLSGPLGDILSSSPDHAQLTFADRGYGEEKVQVYLYFNVKKWVDRVAVLTLGKQITVTGRIDRVVSVWVDLKDCELIEEGSRDG
jgi:hypothetical protein